MNRWRFHLRIMGGGLYWGAWCVIAVMLGVIIGLRPYLGYQPDWSLLLRIATASLPPFTILVFVNAIAEETEQRLLVHLYTLPFSVPRLLAERLLLAITGMLLAWVLLLGAVAIAFGAFPLHDLLTASALALPGNVLLGLAALLAVLLTRTIVGGLLPAFLYYLAELTRRDWPGPLYLIWRGLPASGADALSYSLSVTAALPVAFALLLLAAARLKAWIARSR